MLGNDLFGEPVVNGHKSVLARTFEYPPFSVLSARDGWWQERKRAWLALGIQSEIGRDSDLIPNGGATPANSDTRGGGADFVFSCPPYGDLPGPQFKAGRKLGKTHQNILVFCKGDPKKAAAACEGLSA